jgi:hypothetical protein
MVRTRMLPVVLNLHTGTMHAICTPRRDINTPNYSEQYGIEFSLRMHEDINTVLLIIHYYIPNFRNIARRALCTMPI